MGKSNIPTVPNRSSRSKKESLEDERTLARRVFYLHQTQGIGFAKIAQKENTSKTGAFRLYHKYKHQFSEEIEKTAKVDLEYQRLKSFSVDLRQQVEHYEAKQTQQREIEDLLLRKAETDEGLKDIFSSHGNLWEFACSMATRIADVSSYPDVWKSFLAYCKSRKLSESKKLFEIVGDFASFQKSDLELDNYVGLELGYFLDEAKDEERKATFQKKFDDIIKNFRCGDCGRGFKSMVIVLPDRDKYTRILCPCGSPYEILCPADCQARLNFQVDGTHWKCPKCGLVLERTKLVERDCLDKFANELNP